MNFKVKHLVLNFNLVISWWADILIKNKFIILYLNTIFCLWNDANYPSNTRQVAKFHAQISGWHWQAETHL